MGYYLLGLVVGAYIAWLFTRTYYLDKERQREVAELSASIKANLDTVRESLAKSRALGEQVREKRKAEDAS